MESEYRYGVFGTCQFSALHCYPDAQPPVEFLRNPHRHIFKVEFRCSVAHDNRDIEFITLKEQLERWCIKTLHGKDLGSTSCEMIGALILNQFPQISNVTVSEDGENGAYIWRAGTTFEELVLHTQDKLAEQESGEIIENEI